MHLTFRIANIVHYDIRSEVRHTLTVLQSSLVMLQTKLPRIAGNLLRICWRTATSQASQHLALSKGFLPDACLKNFAIAATVFFKLARTIQLSRQLKVCLMTTVGH